MNKSRSREGNKTCYMPYNLTNDPLSSFVKDFTFAPHSFGHQERDASAVCDYRVIGDFELIFYVGGESCITIDRHEYICGRGDVVLVPPFAVNKIQTSPSNPHDDYWIHFDLYPFYRHDDFINTLLNGKGNRIKVDCFDELLELYRRMEREVETKAPGSKLLTDNLFTQIITLLFRSVGNTVLDIENPAGRNLSDISIVNSCLEYIHAKDDVPIRIEDICQSLHISESYLFKTFSSVMKMPPGSYIQLYRIKRAEQLMKTTELTFKEISERLGFASPYYFSRVFKKYYHLSPRDYMNRFHAIGV
jgi:AraC-like DNA-binding protein